MAALRPPQQRLVLAAAHGQHRLDRYVGLHLPPHALEDVDVAVLIDADLQEAARVVALARADGVVRRGVNAQVIGQRHVRSGAVEPDVLALEQIAVEQAGPLLVERGEAERIERLLLLEEGQIEFVGAVGPQRLARCAAERIVLLSDGGEIDDLDLLGELGVVVRVFRIGEPADRVVRVPAGEGHDDQLLAHAAAHGDLREPVPRLIADRLGLGFLIVFD